MDVVDKVVPSQYIPPPSYYNSSFFFSFEVNILLLLIVVVASFLFCNRLSAKDRQYKIFFPQFL